MCMLHILLCWLYLFSPTHISCDKKPKGLRTELSINCCLTEHCLFCWLLASFFTFYGSKLYFTASVWMIGLQWCPVLQLGVGYFASCGALFHNFTSHCHVYPIFATDHRSGDDIIQIIGEMQLWNQVCRGKNFRNQNYDERAPVAWMK